MTPACSTMKRRLSPNGASTYTGAANPEATSSRTMSPAAAGEVADANITVAMRRPSGKRCFRRRIILSSVWGPVGHLARSA